MYYCSFRHHHHAIFTHTPFYVYNIIHRREKRERRITIDTTQQQQNAVLFFFGGTQTQIGGTAAYNMSSPALFFLFSLQSGLDGVVAFVSSCSATYIVIFWFLITPPTQQRQHTGKKNSTMACIHAEDCHNTIPCGYHITLSHHYALLLALLASLSLCSADDKYMCAQHHCAIMLCCALLFCFFFRSVPLFFPLDVSPLLLTIIVLVAWPQAKGRKERRNHAPVPHNIIIMMRSTTQHTRVLWCAAMYCDRCAVGCLLA